MGPARRRGKSARRIGGDRHPGRHESAAGWLHLVDGIDWRADGGIRQHRYGWPFDVNKVLSPIVVAAAPPYLLVVSPTLPANSVADLIRYAKQKPEGLTFGSAGVGAASHLSGLLFASNTGIKMLHIPYKGTGPAVTDLLGGRIDVMFAPGPVVQQFVQSGQLKALGVTDTIRSKFYPDIPPVSEAVTGYELVGWFGLLAPPNTPREIVRQLNEVIVAAMQHAGISRPSGDTGRRAQTANAGTIRPIHQCRRRQMEQACERQRRAIAGRKVNMRLASFVDPSLSRETRFGIVRGDDIVDVVAAANALHRAVPGNIVKIALTSGKQMFAALEELAGFGRTCKAASSGRRPEVPAADSGPVEILLRRQEQQEASRGTGRQQDADGNPERADRVYQA